MGCFSSWFQVLPYRFLCSFIVLPPLASRSVYYRSCRPENSCEGVPTQAFSAFLRDVSQAPLPITDCAHVRRVLRTAVLCQLRFGLGYFHCYSGFFCLLVLTEFAFTDTWYFAMAPSSLRGAEGRWRCRRLLVSFSGSLHQTLSLCPCAATVQRAPSHNRWGVSETTLPAKTQGRTLDCPFNFPPPRVAGWLLMCRCQVCNKAAVALEAPGPRRGAL